MAVKRTVKVIALEISRAENKKQQITDLIQAKMQEMKDIDAEILALKAEQAELAEDEMKNAIDNAWFKGNKISEENLNKILSFEKMIKDKINDLTIDDLVQAVDMIYEDKKK